MSFTDPNNNHKAACTKTMARRTRTNGVWLLSVLMIISSTVQARTYYYHNDHLGTPQALTDENQNVVWQAHYDPFGKTSETVNTVEQNLRFPGQYLDRETGLHYNWHRHYDPETGRYTQSDPIGLSGGINPYGYTYQNPINYKDADGHLAIPAAVIPVVWGIATTAAVWWGFNNPWATGHNTTSGLTDFPAWHNNDNNAEENCPVPGSTLADRQTKGRSTLWDKEGDFSDAQNDFDDYNPSDVKSMDDGGSRGTLPDGRKIIVRPTSTDGRPTLEIQRGKRRDKVRYGKIPTNTN